MGSYTEARYAGVVVYVNKTTVRKNRDAREYITESETLRNGVKINTTHRINYDTNEMEHTSITRGKYTETYIDKAIEKGLAKLKKY